MKIAFVTSRFPFPVEKGDKLRAYHHLRWLGARHEVHLFAITHRYVAPAEIEAVREFCAGVHVYRITRLRLIINLVSGWLRGLPAQVAYFLDQAQRSNMQRDLIRLNPQHIFVQLIRAAEYARILPVAKTLDYMDVFSVGAHQRSRNGFWLFRPFFAEEARRLRKYERSVYPDFTYHTIISEQDRNRLPLPYQGNVRVISNGVDLEYFAPMEPGQKKFDVVFVGNMGYLPNIEAAEYLVRRVMPQLWRRRPEATVCLAGVRPHPRVQRLASDRVHVTGWVDDIRPWYASARVFVAPMFSGLGQQNKILEAMAMGLPCITTEIVDRAIGASRADALRVADTPEDFASQIHVLLADADSALELGSAARTFVSTHYDWESQNKALEALLSQCEVYSESEPLRI